MVQIARTALGDSVFLFNEQYVVKAAEQGMKFSWHQDPGDPVVVPAGSIVCFSSTLLHRSGANTTDQARRVYVAQYSAEPILSEDGLQPRILAEPLLIDGDRLWPTGRG
jgi:ectoine hydroxylase-related dioxygenase (phytanoyl-CoA dioxygenase family)